MFENMSEQKLKKTVAGMFVAGTLLVVILLGVMLYQFVSMGLKSAQKAALEKEIAQYEEKIQVLDKDLDYYESDYYKELMGRAHGYVYPEE
ncbi:MAG: hypothetical protein IJY26_00660 [Clostridia bacterium]|nr:hypothetical protein [Clostridia bacterium]